MGGSLFVSSSPSLFSSSIKVVSGRVHTHTKERERVRSISVLETPLFLERKTLSRREKKRRASSQKRRRRREEEDKEGFVEKRKRC